jgi:hypothetical protein
VYVVVGIACGTLFRLTRNLLVLWPLAWGAASSLGTAQGGFFFDWTVIPIYLVLLAIQLGSIAYAGRRPVASSAEGQERMTPAMLVESESHG